MDQELETMNAIARILAELDPEVADRVIRWAADRYGSGIYLAADDLDGLEAASRAAGALEDRRAAAPSGDPDRGIGKVRRRQPAASGPGEAEGSRDAQQGARPPKKNSDKPSFLDTQYRMSVAKHLIEKGDDDES